MSTLTQTVPAAQTATEMLTLRTRIYFDKKTEAYVNRCFGVRRWIWNFFLAHALEQKRTENKLPSSYELMKEFRTAVAERNDSGFAWLTENMVATRVLEEVSKDIGASFKLCRDATKEKHNQWFVNLHKPKDKRKKKHYRDRVVVPKFKSRKDRKQTFSVYNGNNTNIRIDSDRVISFVGREFRVIGRVRESLSFLKSAKLKRITITRKGGKYFIAIAYEIAKRVYPKTTSGKIGLDLGVKVSVTSFDGTKLDKVVFNTKNARRIEARARKIKLSSKVEGSKRYEKAVLRKEKLYDKAARIRNEYLEWYTTWLCRNYREIVVDKFNFTGSLAVADHGEAYRSMIYQFMLRLEQKAANYGVTVKEVPHKKGVKTTRLCANCGSENVVVRKDRHVSCKDCSCLIDRDFTAAINCYAMQI